MATERRLIDANALLAEVVKAQALEPNTAVAKIIMLVTEAERVDAVVLPCKLGETVYMIRSCSCYNDPHFMRKHSTKCASKVYVGKSVKKCTHCAYVSETKFELKHIADLGKLVFLTHEEAEAALAERRTDNA